MNVTRYIRVTDTHTHTCRFVSGARHLIAPYSIYIYYIPYSSIAQQDRQTHTPSYTFPGDDDDEGRSEEADKEPPRRLTSSSFFSHSIYAITILPPVRERERDETTHIIAPVIVYSSSNFYLSLKR